MTLQRDERQGRLHCRFTCVDHGINCSAGFLGQSVTYSPDALGINKATEEIYSEFCTKFRDAPPGAAVQPVFDNKLSQHMRVITEAVCADSASNEMTAIVDMTLPSGSTPPFAPNCRFILRDSAHNARRVIQRPWKADEALSDVMGLL